VYDTEGFGAVPVLDAVVVADEESGAVTVFAVNRHQQEELSVDVDVRACPSLGAGEHVALFDADPDAVNTAEQPDRVVPRRGDEVKIVDGRATVVLPPLSWNMVRLAPAPA
jgi:alpha-N-arabinofuranosidase